MFSSVKAYQTSENLLLFSQEEAVGKGNTLKVSTQFRHHPRTA